MIKIFLALCVAVCLCMAGCGTSLTPQEAETAIRSELKNMPLTMGVKMKKLDRLEVLKIISSKEASTTPGLSDALDVTGMNAMEEASGTKIFFVLVDMEGTASVDRMNALQFGARGSTTIEGNAWFMLTKDKNNQIKAMRITSPALNDDDDGEYEEEE